MLIIQFYRINPSNKCSNYLEECCELPQIANSPIQPPPPSQPRFGCGQHYPNGKAFKLSGNPKNQAKYSEFPWMVIVLEENNFNGKLPNTYVYKCGGSLIHTKVVLTAALCVVKKKKYKITAGDWDTKNSREIYPNQDREVENVIIHPNFIDDPPTNNIALLFLKTPVDIFDNVNLVCLPDIGTTFDNANCFATGWGKTFYGKNSSNVDILKKISLPIVPRDLCETILQSTRLGLYFILDPSNICAGGNPHEDTCEGDGGSPLVCPVSGKKDTYQQAGIVSWGLGCGDPIPAVYASVAIFRQWIDNTMVNQGLTTTSYQI